MSLAALQERLRDLVAAEPLLADRPILLEDKGNLVYEVEDALATQALAVVISPAKGAARPTQSATQAHSEEHIDVIVYRGPLAEAEAPSTVALRDALLPRLHGAFVAPAGPGVGRRFSYVGHELRDLGDGAYARALTFRVEDLP